MSQRAPSLVSDTHYCVVGDVTIDTTAAIAPGVVLQASTGSRIVVGEGVCLAAGVCIQSRKGILTIESGASLGANVLVVGNGIVGTNACISAGTTVINPAVEAEAVLPPDTLIGANMSAKTGTKQAQSSPSGFNSNSFGASNDFNNSFAYGSAQPASVPQASTFEASTFEVSTFEASTFVEPEPITPKPIQIPEISQQPNKFVSPPLLNQPFSQPFNPSNGSNGFNGSNDPWSNNVQSDYGNGGGNGGSGNQANSSSSFQNGSASGSSSLTVHSSSDRVYGRDQVSQLISTLFPHRQPLDNHSQS